MLNKIMLMGRLTRDPELRRTQSGVSVAGFTLAVDRDYADKGSGKRECDFIDVEAWRGAADFVAKYFRKGQMAVVAGRLQIQDWTDREGGKRRSARVVSEAVYFGESRREPRSEGNADERDLPPAPEQEYRDMEDDGTLPF